MSNKMVIRVIVDDLSSYLLL